MSRTPTAVDTLADDFVARYVVLDPIAATEMGIRGHDHEMTDLSPAGHAARTALLREAVGAIGSATLADDTDRVTIDALRFSLGAEIALDEAGETLAPVNNIASPLQGLRDVFDLMATDTEDDWAAVADRLRALPAAAAGYAESLRAAADAGRVPAVRQIEEGIRQASELADPSSSFFPTFAAGGPEALRDELAAAAADASAAYGSLVETLRSLAPRAPQADGFGRDRYALWSRYFIGATVDLDETYAWGLDQLAAITAEQTRIAQRIVGPGATVEDAIARLDADPARKLHGTDALQRWMQSTADSAVAALDGTHFTIAEPLHRLECRIAPTQTGGIYYTGPSDDLSRPGRMWWSVPPGIEEFSTWRERTTVYHEGVPGHHLQVGTAVVNRDELNDYRRLASWTSGHGEGWALYAERLMADLGFLDDDGDRLGMLDGQRMRAARVVFDIGVHLGLTAPDEFGGGTWDADKGWELLRTNLHQAEGFNRFEWLRYLGWAGQAPSYLVGQRLWLEIREQARAAATANGEQFDLPAFHSRALNLGSLPLEVLATVV
ncbi:MAG TPA: DUF885 domain-containing protein [Cellulomonas sp.]